MPVRALPMPADDHALFERFLEPGTLPWLLARHAERLVPDWLTRQWRGQANTGRPAWPAHLLLGLLLLRHHEGLRRSVACRRADTDACWRAALRLPWAVSPPSPRVLHDFEVFLTTFDQDTAMTRMQRLFEGWVTDCIEAGVLTGEEAWVIDSSPMRCYGAVLDTINLLGEGLRKLVKRFARATNTPLALLAEQWKAPIVLAKSAKGHFGLRDWGQPESLSNVLEQLSEVVVRVVGEVTDALPTVRDNKHLPLARHCRTLLRVVEEDLVVDAHGTFSIAIRRSATRILSLTEPDAQHFRKSSSQVCTGFKLHLLADALSGLIAAVSVRPGGEHDSTQAHPLIARARALREGLVEVLGDSAYGGMPVRNAVHAQLGVRLLAPPPPAPRGEGLGKADFAIDFETMVATCPGGVSTGQWKPTKSNGVAVPTLCWAVGSESACSCRAQCPVHRCSTTKSGRRIGPRRRLPLHPDEEQLRSLRAQWKDDDGLRARYRLRSQGERVIREVMRRGARQAHSFGLAAAQLQAHLAAAASNLRLLATALAARAVHKQAA